jgi:hypothetical protein
MHAQPGIFGFSFRRTIRRRLRVLGLPTLLTPGLIPAVAAQVPNDDIALRRQLTAETAIASSTTGCTVQWSCVDEQLTGKCIKYHNDQWFEFTPKAAGRYFVNISGQQCRDTRGVQLVVLTGTPCQPTTYRVLSCSSLGSQDDVFVTLDSLRAGQPYLLNVDGYLRDYCQFNLTVSRTPRGLPDAALPPAGAASQPNPVVTLRWTLPDSLGAVRQFRVWRREAAAFHTTAQATVPVVRSTFGTTTTGYSWTDTLRTPGRYLYQITTEATDGTAPALVQQQWYSYGQRMPTKPQPHSNGQRQTQFEQREWEKRARQLRRRRTSTP